MDPLTRAQALPELARYEAELARLRALNSDMVAEFAPSETPLLVSVRLVPGL